jgi:hypothetical protein
MPIDPNAIARQTAAQIAAYAVTWRFGSIVGAGSWQTAQAPLQAVDGGIITLSGGTLVAMKSAFTSGLPAVGATVEILMSGTYVPYRAFSIQGREDPLMSQLILQLEPANAPR